MGLATATKQGFLTCAPILQKQDQKGNRRPSMQYINELPDFWHYAKIDLFDNSVNSLERKFTVKILYSIKNDFDGGFKEVQCVLNRPWGQVTRDIGFSHGKDFRDDLHGLLKEMREEHYYARANGCFWVKNTEYGKQKDRSVHRMAAIIGQEKENKNWRILFLMDGDEYLFELKDVHYGKVIASVDYGKKKQDTEKISMKQACNRTIIASMIKKSEPINPGKDDASI